MKRTTDQRIPPASNRTAPLPVAADVRAIADRLPNTPRVSARDAAEALAARAGEAGKVVTWSVGKYGIVIAGTGANVGALCDAIGLDRKAVSS